MKRNLLFPGMVLVIVLYLSACGMIRPKPADIQGANFGTRPSNYEAIMLVKNNMSTKLFDPYSAVYECSEPKKAWANFLGNLYYGYAVTCNINAKNRFGGYVGSQSYNFMINSNSIILEGWARAEYVE